MKKDKRYDVKLCSVKLENRDLQYTLKRSSRKTISIAIEKNGCVKVASPYGVSEYYLNRLLQQKARWILKKLEDVQTKWIETRKKKVFEDGQYFYYLGKQYELKIISDNQIKKPDVTITGENIVIEIPYDPDEAKIGDVLKLWYINQFKLLVRQKIEYYSKIIGVHPQKIAVREQKTRWGSCSTKGNINLNWKLIMAPPEIVDYVIVHELCHMRAMNHSKEFWKLVESYCPGYKKCRTWLKASGDNLSWP